MRIDLHIHSSASDGALAPAEIVAAAAAGRLDVVALADHDTAAGVEEAAREAPAGLRVIPAIEISATGQGGDRHILGYGIDIAHPAIACHTGEARRARSERMRAMLAALERLGAPVSLESVESEAAGAPLARPHLARAMVSAGIVKSHGEAFARYLGDAAPAYVATDTIDVATAIQRIAAAGGLSVWAHPPPAAISAELDRYVGEGLDGLEVYRPRQTREATRRMARLARGRRLLASGGSDWHGPWDVPLGTFAVSREQIEPLMDRLGVAAPGTSTNGGG